MQLTQLSTTDERNAWLKEQGLENFTLINATELDILKNLARNNIKLANELKFSLEDSDRLDCLAYIFSHYKIGAVNRDGKMMWSFSHEGKDYGPFNIRELIDRICIINGTTNPPAQNG